MVNFLNYLGARSGPRTGSPHLIPSETSVLVRKCDPVGISLRLMLEAEESPCIDEADKVCTDIQPAEEGRNTSKLAEGSRHRILVHNQLTVDDQRTTRRKKKAAVEDQHMSRFLLA